MTKGSDNVFPKLLESMNTSDPAAPSDSSWKIYAKAPGIYARSSNAIVGPFGTGGGTITTKDEGSTLSTSVTTFDFVGAGVTASGAGATTTVTIAGGSGGGLVLLEQHTASTSATLDFTTFYSATYDDYLFELLNLIPATNNVDFYIGYSVNGGSSYDTASNYSNATFAFSPSGSVSTGVATTALKLRNAAEIDSNSNGGVTGTFKMFYPGSTAGYRRALLDCSYLNGDPVQAKTVCEYIGNVGSAINAVRFVFSSGNITSGIIRAYGIVKT